MRRDLAAWLSKWSSKYARLCTWVEENIEETLTYYRLPLSHHKHMKSTNMLSGQTIDFLLSANPMMPRNGSSTRHEPNPKPEAPQLDDAEELCAGQILQQCLRIPQDGVIEALGEPAVQRSKQVAGAVSAPVGLPQPGQSDARIQLDPLGVALPRPRDRSIIVAFPTAPALRRLGSVEDARQPLSRTPSP